MQRQGINVRANADLYPPRGWWHGGLSPHMYEPAHVPPVIDHANQGNQLPEVPREKLVDFTLGYTVEVPGRLQRPASRRGSRSRMVEFFDLPESLPLGGISHLGEENLSSWQGGYVDIGDVENLFEVPDEAAVSECVLGSRVLSSPRSTQAVQIGGLAVQPEFVVEEIATASLTIQ